MRPDPDSCYRALLTRDRRFDGLFFVGVTTTGVYCRPICPARTPRRERCRFFERAGEAERAGFRACFRCRPELAPGHAPVDAPSRLVGDAIARIEAGCLNEAPVEALAGALGVTSRHLRRVFEAELGVTPVELGETRRLALAKQLLQDTVLSTTQVAFAAGYGSLRRFHASFRRRFGAPPRSIRRRAGAGEGVQPLTLRLDYRPPLAFDRLLAFLSGRAIQGVEAISGGVYRRNVRLGEIIGQISVTAHPSEPAVIATISWGLAPKLMEVAARIRALFDLNARPQEIEGHLARDPRLRGGVRACPGLRVPGAFDPFEVAIRAILGQQVSVRAASTLAGRLVERFGARVEGSDPALLRVFPAPAVLAEATPAALASIGVPLARAAAIRALARAVEDRAIGLRPGAAPEPVVEALQAIRGIGPWTASYIALRALGWPDAFSADDLGVRKALGLAGRRAILERAERWRPWRAYAVMHLWSGAGEGG